MTEDRKVLAILQPSLGRRIIGIGSLCAIGFFVGYLSFMAPGAFFWQLVLFIIAIVAIWAANQIRLATQFQIEMTDVDIRDSSGAVLAEFDEIEKVDRGVFAFKPSNGFLLLLKKNARPSWQPGMWWRFGRRVGVGGMTAGAEAKFMADLIAMRLEEIKSQ